MIAALRGTLREKGPTRAVIDCFGLGLELGIPLSTSSRLGPAGEEAELLVVTRFTRNGVELYGFLDQAERDVFRLLLTVKGIGPKAGLNMLSRFTPVEILDTIKSGRTDVVKTVPGIGPKKAQRILTELAEKATPVFEASPILSDATSALVALGLSFKEARARLEHVRMTDETTLAQVLRLALRTGQG